MLLKERMSLQGMYRVMNISMDWLLAFAEQEYKQAPDDLNVRLSDPDANSLEFFGNASIANKRN